MKGMVVVDELRREGLWLSRAGGQCILKKPIWSILVRRGMGSNVSSVIYYVTLSPRLLFGKMELSIL